MSNIYHKNISLVFELERSIKFLKTGLAEIQKISDENDFYDFIFIFLSGGLERLFKIMLCLSFKDKNGNFPKINECWEKSKGHDLEILKRKIEKICIAYNYDIIDYDIITKDNCINHVCKILSEYGKRGRYFNLDAVLEQDQQFNPKDEWEELEMQIYQEKFGKETHCQLILSNKIDEFYHASNIEIIIRLEKFFRALTRQFIFGNFSKEAKKFCNIIEIFSKLGDSQLGKTNWSINNTPYI
jgi:hypothetical protein